MEGGDRMPTKSAARRGRASDSSRTIPDSTSDGVVETKPASRSVEAESAPISDGNRRPVSRPDSKSIVVRGAREHNLKNIDVTIPRDQLVVITGLSGSGKSSLAFDTIFAEGQRKYMESLSAYARQFLEQLKKPDVDEVEGVPPTIAIEQRSGTGTPRSTVATTTEIYDYLRLLFARCGRPHSWAVTKAKKDGTPTARSGVPISATSSTQIVDSLMVRLSEATGATRLMVLAPVVRGKKGFHREVLEELTQQGWTRARVNGTIVDLRDVLKEPGENPLKLGRYEKHTIEAVVDRLSMHASPDTGSRQRLAESIEAALRLGEGGVVTVSIETPSAKGVEWRDTTYSTRFADPDHPEVALEELAPRLFSFNSPFGACPTCNGLGTAVEFDESLIVPDNSVLLGEGAIAPWNKNGAWRGWFNRKLRKFCAQFGGSMQRPIGDLTKDQRQILLYGEPDTAGANSIKKGWGKRKKHWEGVIPEIAEWWKSSESDNVKEFLGRFLSQKPCATCLGDRLKIEALHVLLASTHKADMKKAASETVIGRPKHDGTMLNIAELSRLTIPDAAEFLERVVLSEEQTKIAEPILKEINNRLRFLRGVGLEYLSLDRRTATLSGGEAQRIRLASQVGSGLVGACYVLDEPTIGLHQRDNDRLIATLRHLADIGNTVLVVEHDEDMIRAADHVLDIGPGPGVHGGRVVAQGTVEEICHTPGSFTGDYLSGRKSIDVPTSRRDVSESRAVVVKGASENNLKNIDVAFPLGGLVCVTGVSGSGKSTLVTDILLQSARKHITGSRVTPGKHKSVKWPKSLDRVIEVDQTPIGRTPRSNPATYTGIFDEIRKVFVTTKEAKIRGYKPGRFSFNVPSTRGGGRCEACQGQGLKKIEMHFLPDVYVPCEVCHGKRYNRETLEVKYRGQSIADVLDMTVEKAVGFFENHPKIARFLQCLHDVGLDYLQLGQPSTTLSGGEAQRIKLASELGKTAGAYAAVAQNTSDTNSDDADALDSGSDDADLSDLESDDEESSPTRSRLPRAGSSGSTLYILDEPTTGLHFEDIRKLVEVFDRLADAGNTLVVIEHNLDVIKRADWLIDLGPEGGEGGGRVIATGTPEAVARAKGSHTGQYLARMLR